MVWQLFCTIPLLTLILIQSLSISAQNICRYQTEFGNGICGFNSICSLDDSQRPTCRCPEGYTLQDPNNTNGSCVPNFNLSVCGKHGQGDVKADYKLLRHNNTNFPTGDYSKVQPSTEEDCKNSCLNDCLCVAIHFNAQSRNCWKKRFPLANGVTGPDVNGTMYLKVAKGNITNNPVNPLYPISSPGEVKYKKNDALLALMGSSICVNLILLTVIIFGLIFMYKKKHSRLFDDCQSRTLNEYSNVHSFSYKELEDATDGFKKEIGRGAFGTVYKGRIGRGSFPTTVAVKRLDRISKEADKEFTTEVNVIGQTHHKNLVRFIGFCKEEDQRLLVYEYMSNGTVADYLFGDLRPSWTARIEIAHGISRGLLYLHEECSTQIIHCDIKPQNVLLDEYYNPRISDFGLAKLLVLNQTHTNTAIRGTKGYLAPEWFRNKPVTSKVDVYSFGVLLLEIISCRRSICMDISEEQAILTDWAFDCFQSNTLESLVSDDTEALNDMERLERFVMVALWCIQEDPSLRPTMKKATQMLEGVSEVATPPCTTSFSVTIQP